MLCWVDWDLIVEINNSFLMIARILEMYPRTFAQFMFVSISYEFNIHSNVRLTVKAVALDPLGGSLSWKEAAALGRLQLGEKLDSAVVFTLG